MQSTREPPRKVALFSGHMIDAPDRKTPRFPADKAPSAAGEIAKALTGLEIGAHDLAICGGACGGDLLFAEAALAREAALELYIPFETTDFLAKSVDFAGEVWRDKFFAVEAHAALHVAPHELRPLQDGEDPYERLNEWMLSAAMRFGAEKLNLICLWDGSGGDGPGGTGHMINAVRKRGGRTEWIDTTKLWT